MEERSAVAIDSYRWRLWKDAALASERAAKRLANLGFVLVTTAAAVLGVMTLNDEWRYSAIVYAPVLGFLVWETIKSAIGPIRFRAAAHSIREVLVPGLVDRIDDAQVLQLARYGGVLVGGQSVRVIDDGGYVQFVIAGDDEESNALAGGANGFVGSSDSGDFAGGGDFGGGGGGGGDGGGC